MNFFRKQSLNINEHQLFRWTSANESEKRKGKEGLPLSSPLSHWLMWSRGYSSKVPFTHTCPASSHLTSYCAGLSKIISLDYLDCDKLTTMHKVFFLIVFGIGVKQVSENLFVRILFAYCWVEQTTLTWWSRVNGIYMHNLTWHTSNAPTVYHEFSKILSILAAWSTSVEETNIFIPGLVSKRRASLLAIQLSSKKY